MDLHPHHSLRLEFMVNYILINVLPLIDIMWPLNQSHFHVSHLISLKFIYLLSLMCDVLNEVCEHINNLVNYDNIIIH